MKRSACDCPRRARIRATAFLSRNWIGTLALGSLALVAMPDPTWAQVPFAAGGAGGAGASGNTGRDGGKRDGVKGTAGLRYQL